MREKEVYSIFCFFITTILYEKLDQKAKFILNFFTEKRWVKEKKYCNFMKNCYHYKEEEFSENFSVVFYNEERKWLFYGNSYY